MVVNLENKLDVDRKDFFGRVEGETISLSLKVMSMTFMFEFDSLLSKSHFLSFRHSKDCCGFARVHMRSHV